MNTLGMYTALFMQGIAVTLAAWIVASCVSLVIGACLGIMSCRYRRSVSGVRAIRVYTFIAKGIPAYVQILIAYFIVPALLGIQIPGFVAATIALAFCSSGYVTEIVRAGINAVPTGQWDACTVLGYSFSATMRRIIMPQAFKNMAPALFGECEQLLKSTSLLATIGITELTRTGMNIISRELNPVPVYLAIAGIYLLFAALLNVAMLYAEREVAYGQR
jgi:His/Glu/Gln/Arg/opine family amino acid ABC transporter permease subunit